jgi:hypothetical protein
VGCWQCQDASTRRLNLPGFVRRLSPAQPNMEASETIQCPYCGQIFDLVIDTSTPTQRFTTDCEVCCRPFEVFVECKPGEVLNLEVRGA